MIIVNLMFPVVGSLFFGNHLALYDVLFPAFIAQHVVCVCVFRLEGGEKMKITTCILK